MSPEGSHLLGEEVLLALGAELGRHEALYGVLLCRDADGSPADAVAWNGIHLHSCKYSLRYKYSLRRKF